MIISEFARLSAALRSVVSTRKGHNMLEKTTTLDQMQTAYIAAVEQWIDAIKQEEALASVNHTVAELDKWENAHFKEDEIRNRVKAAKRQYENALREKFFGF
jgi:vacuolar-type H+-ATPase subunit C/Vma6